MKRKKQTKRVLNKAISKKLILIILFSIAFATIIIFQVYEHEKVHQQIFTYFGCESKITINMTDPWTVSGRTTPINCTISKDKIIPMYSLHAQNEIISYNLQALEFLIYISILFLIAKN